MTRRANIKAILFDMDGVLVDSEPVITASAIEALRAYGVDAREEEFRQFSGMGEIKFIGGVSEKHGVPFQMKMKDETYAIYLTMVERELVVYPGTPDTLRRLREAGYAMALASSADRVKIDANLRVAGIDPETFGVILSGDDVERKKPFPDIYLTAAERLGVPISECAVIEDALSGVEAAKAAGAYCVAVSTTFPVEELKNAGADAVVSAVEDIISQI